MERFTILNEYPQYKFSNLGRVWSEYEQRFLKGYVNKFGYLMIKIKNKNGESKGRYVHRLIFEAFYRRPLKNEEVHHLDKCKMNCSTTNLVAWDNKRHKEYHRNDQETQLKKRTNQSRAMKGRVISEETKKKISEANKGRVAWNKGIKSTRQKDPITGRFLKTNKQL